MKEREAKWHGFDNHCMLCIVHGLVNMHISIQLCLWCYITKAYKQHDKTFGRHTTSIQLIGNKRSKRRIKNIKIKLHWLFNDAVKICSTQMNWKQNWLHTALSTQRQYRCSWIITEIGNDTITLLKLTNALTFVRVFCFTIMSFCYNNKCILTKGDSIKVLPIFDVCKMQSNCNYALQWMP